jgi:small-conductance mechanosensitive channel
MSFEEIFEKFTEIVDSTIFTINQTPVTLTSFFIFFVIIIIFVLLSKIVKNRFLAVILSKLRIEEGLQFTLTRVTQYIIVFIGVIVALQFIGIDLSGLAVVLGFLSVGIGFGLQNITSNFIAGLILLFERPIKVGDRVTVGDTEGDVLNINIRSTTIRSLNNISIIVPNSQFVSSQVINWSHGETKIRMDLPVGVSYNSDLDTVMKALSEVAEENEDVLSNPAPEVQLAEFGDSSWNMQLRVWIEHPQRYYYVRSDINTEIVRKFRKYGVEIPYPQRDLHLRSTKVIPLKKEEN